jgi:hypothetical protein
MSKELNLRGRHNGEDARQTQPKVDGRPASVAEIDKLYAKDRVRGLNHADGDGLVSVELHSYETRMQQPQALGDHDVNGRLPGYVNDVPLTGKRSFLRGAGRGGEDQTFFDRGKLDPSNQPGRWGAGGGKLKASGQDIPSSPFSAAYRKGAGEGF